MTTMTIHPEQQCLTIIDVIRVDPQRSTELIEVLQEISDNVMSRQPGFLGAALHSSLDGCQVVSYVKWQSREAWRAAVKRHEAKAGFARVAFIANKVEPSLYRVETVHAPGSASFDERAQLQMEWANAVV
jgi:heme-degrading monooxygenase HmoA